VAAGQGVEGGDCDQGEYGWQQRSLEEEEGYGSKAEEDDP